MKKCGARLEAPRQSHLVVCLEKLLLVHAYDGNSRTGGKQERIRPPDSCAVRAAVLTCPHRDISSGRPAASRSFLCFLYLEDRSMARILAGIVMAMAIVMAGGCVSKGVYNKDMKAQKALTQEAMDKAATAQKEKAAAIEAKDAEIQALNKALADVKAALIQAQKDAATQIELGKNSLAAMEAAQKQMLERAEKAEAEARLLAQTNDALHTDIARLTKQLEEAKTPAAAPAPARVPGK